jgi:hypothetical protein
MDAPALVNRAAGLIASLLLGRASRYTGMRVLLDDKSQPSTDGRTVWLPRMYEGFDLLEDAWVGVALLAHEFGHWLQPLDQIDEVELETGLDHKVVNYLLDIHDDAMIDAAFPLFGAAMTRLRGHLAASTNVEGLKAAARCGVPFFESKAALVCYRFEIVIDRAFWPDNWCDVQNAADQFTWYPPAELPERLRAFADQFPELCRPSPDQSGAGNTAQDAARVTAARLIRPMTVDRQAAPALMRGATRHPRRKPRAMSNPTGSPMTMPQPTGSPMRIRTRPNLSLAMTHRPRHKTEAAISPMMKAHPMKATSPRLETYPNLMMRPPGKSLHPQATAVQRLGACLTRLMRSSSNRPGSMMTCCRRLFLLTRIRRFHRRTCVNPSWRGSRPHPVKLRRLPPGWPRAG